MSGPDPQRLADLAVLTDQQYVQALIRHLARSDAALTEAFRHPAMRRRSRHALAAIITECEKQDRKGRPPAERQPWQQLRLAARAERDVLKALPEPFDPQASPRRRALQRLCLEYASEFGDIKAAAATAGKPKNINRNLMEQLSARHPVRMIEILREEQARGTATDPAA